MRQTQDTTSQRVCLHFFSGSSLPSFVPALFDVVVAFPQVVGVVVLLGPRVQGLVSTLLQVEAGKRSRFPPGLEPQQQRGARDGVGVAGGEGAGGPSAKKVLKVRG